MPGVECWLGYFQLRLGICFLVGELKFIGLEVAWRNCVSSTLLLGVVFFRA